MLLKGAFRFAVRRRTALIIPGHIYGGQRDAIAAPGAVIVVTLQGYDRNAGLGTTLRASYKCFTSCHARISFPRYRPIRDL
jgi:hypothetical protein